MNRFVLLALVLFSVCSFDCHSQTLTASEPTNGFNTSNTQTYRLIVSFISKGAGSDPAKRQAFLNYVNQHPKKPNYVSVPWGREGETDYCFTLKKLSKREQKAFIHHIKKMIGHSDLIQLMENVPCLR